MILRTTLSTLLLLCSLAANAQDFFSEFIEHFNARDTLKQRLTLERWEAESPEDPELFVSYFNYYFERSKVRGLQMSVTTPDGQTQGSDENRQDINDFLADKTFFVGSIFNKGISNIDRGIGLYPDRLDMRYAKIDALGQNEEWDAFVAAIKDMVARSSVNKNQWLGVQNAPYEGNEETFLSKIQEYHITILNLQDIQLLPKIRESAEAVLSYYPKHVTSLSDLGVTYLIEENYEKTLDKG